MTAFGGMPGPYYPHQQHPVARVNPAVLVGVSVWRLAIIGCALYGFSDATGWSQNFEGLSQQASLVTAIVYTGLLLYPAFTGGTRHEPKSPWPRGATTVLLLLVAGTYFGIMGGEFDYLPFEHVYTPLIVLVDWLFVGRNQASAKWWYPLTWIAFPLAYLVYFLSAEVYQYLYPFLDPDGDEFAAMIGGLLAGVIVIGYLLYGLGKLKGAIGGPPQPRHLPDNRFPAPPPPWGYNGPPGAPAPRGGRGGKVAIIVAVAVALVAAGGGVWLWQSGGSGEGASTEAAGDWDAGVSKVGAAEESWRVTQGEAPEAIGVGDHWVTENQLVRRLPGRVTAYELTTGEAAWEFPLDGLEDRCPSSQEHSKNRVALLRSTEDSSAGAECGKLTVLDISTGKELFTTELPPAGHAEVTTADVPAVFGETVVIPGRGGARILDLATGKVLSNPDPDSACAAHGAGVFGDMILAHTVCDDGDDERTELRALDANLELVWKWETPRDEEGNPLPVYGVLSVDPLVVSVGHGGRQRELLRVDPKSGKSVEISAYDGGRIRGKYYDACDGYALGSCQQANVVDNTVILPTTPLHINPGTPDAYPGMQNTEYRNELVAFDLDTGEETWRTGIVDGRMLHPVPTDDGGVVVFQPANANGTKAMLLSVDAATGRLSPLLPIGPKAHEDDDLVELLRTGHFGGDNEQAVYREGLFVMFGMVHRAETQGDVETVTFALSD